MEHKCGSKIDIERRMKSGMLYVTEMMCEILTVIRMYCYIIVKNKSSFRESLMAAS